MRKFSDIINELADVAPLSKGADYLAVRLHIVRWVRDNWLAGKFDIFGRLNGEGVLKVVQPDPFLDFFSEVEGTELIWRIRRLPEGRRLPREEFWGELAISADAASQLRDAIAGRLSPVDAPRGSNPAPQRQKGATDRARAELLYEAARPYKGSQVWSTETALTEARNQTKDNPLLKQKDMRLFRSAWSLAKPYLKIEPRPQRIDWDER